MKMPFGRFKGCRVADLPNEYLDWLHRLDDLRGRLRSEVDAEWSARFHFESRRQRDPLATVADGLDAEDRALLGELVRAGYRTLALKCHPDHGGDPDSMRRLNRLMERLRGALAA